MIEVNDYVRTKDGHIAKYIKKLSKDEDVSDGMLFDGYIYEKHKHIRYSFLKEIIVKHSKQLIDLIENKDILKVRIDKTIMFFGIDEGTSNIKYKEIIKSIENGECELLEILTHQQFEANCYKVGGEDGKI